MRALVWHGKHDVRVDTVDDPEILNPRDAIIKVTSTAICGSDLHLYDGYIPTMQAGDILGHEFMGEVVEAGPGSTLEKGQRVVVPFTISCGSCFHCGKHQYSACDNALPADNQDIAQALYGQPMSGLFGYSHMTGGYSGGQAEYVRVPFSDVGPIVIPDGVEDEKVLFLSDILPTGWMAAENAAIEPGDTVAVWGCGPVGLFAVQSAFLMGAERVIAIDHFPRRLALAKRFGAETINFEESATYEALMEMTGGIGPDACIDAVGLEAHGFFVDNVIDQIKASTFLGTDRAHAIRQAILACRKGGRVSMPAVYGGFVDKFPLGAFMEKGLTLRTGQTHVQHYMPGLLNAVLEGKIDTTFLISHTLPLEEAPAGYKMFHDSQNEVTKVVLKPGLALAAKDGYDLVVVADEPLIAAAADDFRQFGTRVEPVEADLSTIEGVERLLGAASGRQIDVLVANAGVGTGGAFLEQDVAAWRHSIETNVTGTVYLLQRVLQRMVMRGQGKVLVTGSIAGYIPGSFNAIYNATKAFVDNFTEALRNELKHVKGVTLTTLMPGATDTEFFARAGMLDTRIGQDESKADPAKVARDGWDAMKAGKGHIVSGWSNKLQVAAAGIVPQSALAEMHRGLAEPGSGED